MKYIPVPLIAAEKLPPEEREHSWAIQLSLNEVAGQAHAFSDAVDLYQEAFARLVRDRGLNFTNHQRIVGRLGIASRDAAMTLFHFKKSLDATRTGLHRCPTLKLGVDMAGLVAVKKAFNQRFKHTDDTRHATAHHAEMFESAEKFAEHFTTTGGVVQTRNYGERYCDVMYRRRMFPLELTVDAAQALEKIARSVFDAYGAASPLVFRHPEVPEIEEVLERYGAMRQRGDSGGT